MVAHGPRNDETDGLDDECSEPHMQNRGKNATPQHLLQYVIHEILMTESTSPDGTTTKDRLILETLSVDAATDVR